MERKLREIGESIVITLPKQVRDINNFKPGDNLTIEQLGLGELRLRKI